MLLDWDILFLIAGFTIQSDSRDTRRTRYHYGDLSRLMRTCCTLYTTCMPILLRQRIVINPVVRRVFSLRAFLYNERHGRARSRAIRAVELCGIPFDYVLNGRPDKLKHVVQAMADILGQCSRIDSLIIMACEYLFSEHDNLVKAVASLRHVTELQAFDICSSTADLITEMKSPVKSALLEFEIGICNLEADFGANPVLRDGVFVLRRFTQHLEQAQICYMGDFFMWNSLRFRKVRRIVMESYLHDLDLDAFAYNFPNLKELDWDFEDLDDDMVEEGRESSLKNRADNDPSFPSYTWTSLDRLRCGVHRTYSLAFPCKVHIWEDVYINQMSDLRYFHVVLCDIRPVVLDVCFDGSYEFGITDMPALSPLSSIQHLRISIRVYSEIHDLLVRLLVQKTSIRMLTMLITLLYLC